MIDYKKIIKSRKLRLQILRLLKFVPDVPMLKIQYRIKTGHKLNLANPQRFTEKLQWYKLYYHDPVMSQCVDKYEARDFVRSRGLEDILIEDYGVYDSPEQVPWEQLPDELVIKDTLGGGGNAVVVCTDKSKLDLVKLNAQMQDWIKTISDGKDGGREWVYAGRPHRIYIEKLLPSNPDEGGLIDYKFFCFNGRAEYIYVIADRIPGVGGGLGIFTRDYEQLDALRMDERPLERHIPRPDNYDELLAVAEKLAAGFPEVRIDLYDIEGKIYFGEMTFFDGSGYMTFDPDAFDFKFGEKFVLPAKREG